MENDNGSTTLSIVVACYNCSETLEACIDSVGDRNNVQVILVDDASSDSTSRVINRLKDDYNQLEVTIVKNEHNYGPGPTRNVGIAAAHNDYITFVDSDDRLSSDAITTIMEILESDNPDILIFDAYIERDTRYKYLKMFIADDIREGLVSSRDALLYGRGCTMGKVYRRNLIGENDITFLDIPRAEDVPFAKVAFASANVIRYVEAPLYYYLENTSSIMHDDSTLNTDNLISVFSAINSRIDSENMQEELECLYYILVAYPTMITMIRKGSTTAQCSDEWQSMCKNHTFRGKLYKRLDAKYRAGYWMFRFRMFYIIRWMLDNA